MTDLHTSSLLSVEEAIRYVLFRYWNPLHLQNDAEKQLAYNRYVLPLRQMLATSSNQCSLAKFLSDAKTKDFGVISFPKNRDRQAAKRLLEIDTDCRGDGRP